MVVCMSRRAVWSLLVAMLVVVAACGDDDAAPTGDEVTATGVIMSVQGDLTSVDSFSIRLENGSDLALVPADGLLFEDSSPLSHLSEHQLNGSPVSVTYIAAGDPPYVCTAVGDAEGDGHTEG
jgi:hypothetical protein